MTTEHSKRPTPGPWIAIEVGQGGPADDPMPVYEIHSADCHSVIAEYVDGKNAPLIAACPDLLSALRQCAAALRQCAHIPGVTEQAIWVADAAISKALGDAA